VLLVANTLTGTIIQRQEVVLEAVVALAFFVPLLIDTGGNVGAQSSTVVIRGLSTEEIVPRDGFTVIGREVLTGGLLGGLLAIVTVIWAYFVQGDWLVAYVVGLSLFAIALLASFAGAALPLLFHWLKRDPALMSSPFITTIVDVLGVLIYFTMARLLLPIGLEQVGRGLPLGA
jgi:magnesium transporter